MTRDERFALDYFSAFFSLFYLLNNTFEFRFSFLVHFLCSHTYPPIYYGHCTCLVTICLVAGVNSIAINTNLLKVFAFVVHCRYHVIGSSLISRIQSCAFIIILLKIPKCMISNINGLPFSLFLNYLFATLFIFFDSFIFFKFIIKNEPLFYPI